jgi:hypothetical protein
VNIDEHGVGIRTFTYLGAPDHGSRKELEQSDCARSSQRMWSHEIHLILSRKKCPGHRPLRTPSYEAL